MPPLVVVGIDGLPPALAERFAADGTMPALGRLIGSGCFGTLRSTPNYQSASAWTSIATGVNPGRHGIVHFTNPIRGSYQFEQIDARSRQAATIWRLLSDAGRRVAVLNMPVSYPAEPVNGVMISGWLCPSPSAEGFTHPPELAAQIAMHVGDYPIHPDVRRHAEGGRYDRAASAARNGIMTKLSVAQWLLEAERPDLLCVVVTETDSLQHWCWHLLDEAHPMHDTVTASHWRESINGVYRTLDDGIAKLLRAAGDAADLLIVSDHGQAPNSGGQVLLRPWLIDAGYLAPGGRSAPRRVADRILRDGFAMLRSGLPNRSKAWLRAHLPSWQTRAQAGVRGVSADWSRTRAFTEVGHVFINLRGRQPRGIVEPGTEYELLLDELSEGLLSLRDADTGADLVAAVERGAAHFHGPEADLMPDLLVHWRPDVVTRRGIWSSGAGDRLVERKAPPRLPPGAHHPDGTLIAYGPSFRLASEAGVRSIYDVAPTIVHLLGCSVPGHFDGAAMLDLLAEEAREEVESLPVNDTAPEAGRNARAGDDEVVMERLRSLGYIE